jgi:hypothetical protein
LEVTIIIAKLFLSTFQSYGENQVPKRIFVVALLVAVALPVSAANISVPLFEMITRASNQDGEFVLTTRSDVDLMIEGGVKFDASLGFNLDTDRLQGDDTLPPTYDSAVLDSYLGRTLAFKSATITARNVADSPINLTHFVGTLEPFATGQTFRRDFGTRIFATEFQGFRYFPDGVVYDGIYTPRGTGIIVGTEPLNQTILAEFYAYQDELLGLGVFANDARVLFNFPLAKVEFFTGASYPAGDYGLYRGGIMMFFDTNAGGQFFGQVGVPSWDPQSGFSLEDFYFLFEPRVTFTKVGAALTLFWHPEVYQQRITDEEGALDINFRLQVGVQPETVLSGGFDSAMEYRPNDDEQVRLLTSPFLRLSTSGVVWDFQIRTQVYPIVPADAFQGFIGVRTSF